MATLLRTAGTTMQKKLQDQWDKNPIVARLLAELKKGCKDTDREGEIYEKLHEIQEGLEKQGWKNPHITSQRTLPNTPETKRLLTELAELEKGCKYTDREGEIYEKLHEIQQQSRHNLSPESLFGSPSLNPTTVAQNRVSKP